MLPKHSHYVPVLLTEYDLVNATSMVALDTKGRPTPFKLVLGVITTLAGCTDTHAVFRSTATSDYTDNDITLLSDHSF